MIPQADKRPHTFDRAMGAELADIARKNRGALTDPHADPQVAAWENADIRFCLTPPEGIPGAGASSICQVPSQFPGAECNIYFGDWGSDSPEKRNVVAADPPQEWIYNCSLCRIPGNAFLPVWRSNDGTLFVLYQPPAQAMLRAFTCIQPGRTDGLARVQRRGTYGWENDPAYPQPVKVNNLNCLVYAPIGELFPAQSQGCCTPSDDPTGICATFPTCPDGSHNYYKVVAGVVEYAGCYPDSEPVPENWFQCPSSSESSSDCQCDWIPTAQQGLTRRVLVKKCIPCGKPGEASVLSTDCQASGSGGSGEEPCTETEVICDTITVCNNSGRPIAPGDIPEKGTATLEQGTCCWSIQPDAYPTRARATLTSNVCPGQTATIENATFPTYCGEWPRPTTAVSLYLAGCNGKKCELVPNFEECLCKWEIVCIEQVEIPSPLADARLDCKSTTCTFDVKRIPAFWATACEDAGCAAGTSEWETITTGELMTFITAADCTGGSGSEDCGTGSFATKTGCVFCPGGASTLPGLKTVRITYPDSFSLSPSSGSGDGDTCVVVANLKSICVLVCGSSAPADAGTTPVLTGTWELFTKGIYDDGCLKQTQVNACVISVGDEVDGAVPGVDCTVCDGSGS